MSKKKTSSKQNKPNTQKPAGKPAKESAAKEKNSSESKKELPESKKETAPKSAATQTQQAKEKKPEADLPKAGKSDSLNKGKTEASATPESAKAESQSAKSEPGASSSKTTASQPKETSKSTAPQQSASKKKDESKPTAKTQKGGKTKKDKAPRQSSASEPVSESPVEAKSESGSSSSGEHSQAVAEAVSTLETTNPEAPAEKELPPALSETTDTASEAEQKRKVAKTLIDEEVDLSAKNAPPVDSAGDKPRTVAKTMLEVSIGGLKDAVAKATGTSPKAEETPRKVPKTLMEINTDSLRDAVEASSRAIEDEIAAAIKESEASADGLRDSVEASSLAIEDEIAAAIKDSEAEQKNASQSTEPQERPAGSPKSADRKIAKTMLDFRAEEFFELANSTTDTLEESSESAAGEFNADPSANQPAPEAPISQVPTQSRKVAKTMLEVDISNINAIVEAASSASQADTEASSQPNIHEPPRDLSAGYDDVSVEDLNEFAQALRDDTAMSPPGSRAERLRKTLLGIRKHGLASSPSMAGINIPAEAEQADLAAEQKPVRVSRSLHPLDNFSFDNLCPADDDASEAQAESVPPEHDVLADSAPSIGEQSPTSSDWDTSADQGAQEKKNTGTVELDHNPHDGGAESEFKGVTTVWPHDEEKKQQEAQAAEAKQGSVKPERFIPKTMLDMDFLKESLSASVVRAEERLAESIAQKAAEPPKQLLTADDYKIASPNCPFVWSENPDNPKERVKYCTNCSAQIYNLTGFDMGESQSLIFKRENRNNAPLYKREDGKFMTSDCPIALKKKKDKQMLIGGAALVLILLVIMVIASFMLPQSQPTANPSADTSSGNPTVTGDTGPGTSGASDAKTSSESSAASSGSSSSKAAPGAYHYVRGKGVVQSEPVVVPPPSPDPSTLPGTTSGYDEGGSFWQYNDKGNN